MKLCLGTAQFGLNYGVSNKNGQVPLSEVGTILDYARSVGIDTLDTAYLYGNSEEVLGQYDLSAFKVITKTIKLNSKLSVAENIEAFDKAFAESLARLKLNSVYALLYHGENDILKDDALWQWGRKLKEIGKLNKLGVSVYTPDLLEKIIACYQIDIVQLPLNIIDQRFVPLLSELKKKGIEIHIRSIFLQGLLLMDPEELSPYFDEIKPKLRLLPKPALGHALNFSKSFNMVDKIVIGISSFKELSEIVNLYQTKFDGFDYSHFAINDEQFVLPQNWGSCK